MSELASGLYVGAVSHQRFTPVRHRLRYAMFQILVDLDELPRLGRALRLFSYNRANLFSFHDKDHGDGRGALKAHVLATLAGASLALEGGRIELLCMPRLLGYVFNPLSIYFCYRADGVLAALLYEVNNTFGERHNYLIAVSGAGAGTIRQSCAKAFYVSPFMDMGMDYDFVIEPPGPGVSTTVHGRGGDGRRVISASFVGKRRELTDGALLAALVSHPLLTHKVIGAIHWQALRLALKGLKPRRRPAPPRQAVTLA